MASLDDFFPEVLTEVEGCPKVLVRNAIRNAAIRFCEMSRYIRQELTPINVVANTHTYTLTPPVGSSIETIIRANITGYPALKFMSEDTLDLEWRDIFSVANIEDWRVYTQDRPSFFNQPTKSSIRLIGIPTTAITAGLELKVALRPAYNATTVDDRLRDEWYEQIGHGAKARLLAMPDKNWTNTKMAAFYMSMFENEDIPAAKGRALRDNARNDETILRTRAYY